MSPWSAEALPSRPHREAEWAEMDESWSDVELSHSQLNSLSVAKEKKKPLRTHDRKHESKQSRVFGVSR